jgi:hypothetical protein
MRIVPATAGTACSSASAGTSTCSAADTGNNFTGVIGVLPSLPLRYKVRN